MIAATNVYPIQRLLLFFLRRSVYEKSMKAVAISRDQRALGAVTGVLSTAAELS